MTMVLAYEDARKIHESVSEEDLAKGRPGRMVQTRFFGSKDTPDAPYARLSHRYPGRVIGPHFHLNDQFQVILEGEGRIGRHKLQPYCVHYTRAYTPYGPFGASAGAPLKYFVLRPHYDIGSQKLPEEREQLLQAPDRRPWQITSKAVFPQDALQDVALRALPDMHDEDGLAVYTLSMKPHTSTHAPAPPMTDGRYVAVVTGSLKHEQKEHNAPALVYVGPNDGPFPLHAGAQGLQALIFNFPRRHTRIPA